MVSKSIAILSAVLVVVALVSVYMEQPSNTNDFQAWKSRFGMRFSGSQDIYREKIYLTNLEKINAHNSLLGRSYDMGMNQFGAMTEQEFAATFTSKTSTKIDGVEIKDTLRGPVIDWESEGAVTKVKNQGSCVAGYAHGAVAAIEGAEFIFNSNTKEFSAQMIVDCSTPYGNTGCFDGRLNNAYDFVAAKGISTESEYPWRGTQGQCRQTSGAYKLVAGSRTIRSGDCDDLAYNLAMQPISVFVDGSRFQFYRQGVFSDCGTSANAGLALVGMTDNYWRLKNSLGTSWGESGFIRLTRGNTCGICFQASYPYLK